MFLIFIKKDLSAFMAAITVKESANISISAVLGRPMTKKYNATPHTHSHPSTSIIHATTRV